jgi:predicted RNA-binding protein YlxR (DUF448 family)
VKVNKGRIPLKKRKIPERMCNGCRGKKPKKELIRIVRSPDQEVTIDTTGKKPGRGAYLCPDSECLKKARKSKALEKALEVDIGPEIWESLERTLEIEVKERDK